MAMGWCVACERLLFIRPGAQKLGSRECEWFPVEHSKLIHGGPRGCGGTAKHVGALDDEHPYKCSVCDQSLTEDDLKTSGSCPGVKREIK